MERFWTLRYLAQRGIQELEASVIREGLVRADALPLVLPVMGANGLPRGARVRVRLGDIDEIGLDLGGTVVERLDTTELPTGSEEEGADDEEQVAGPLTIAVDLSEGEAGETASGTPAAG
jgi:exoribonuclease-2